MDSFNNYVKSGKVKKKTLDPEEAKALLQQANDRLEYTQEKKITEKNAKFVFEGAYEAAREAAQSLMSLKGYKPYSHEATISFVRDFYSSSFPEEDIRDFDRFRQLRNNSVYSASPVTAEDAKSCVSFAAKFISKAEKILKTR